MVAAGLPAAAPAAGRARGRAAARPCAARRRGAPLAPRPAMVFCGAEAAQQRQRLLLAPRRSASQLARIEHRSRHLLPQQIALLGVEPAVEVLAAIEQLVVALFVLLGGAAVEPVLAVRRRCSWRTCARAAAVAPRSGSAPVRRRPARRARSGQQALRGSSSTKLAGLRRRRRSPGASACACCSRSTTLGSSLLPVPGQQLRQFVAHPRRLRAVEVEVAVEPPVADFGQVVVGQLDGAAGGQRGASEQHADNSRQLRATNSGKKA